MTEQQTLFGAVGEPEPGECAHEDTVDVRTSGMHYEDGVDGEDVEWCRGCSDVVGRERL